MKILLSESVYSLVVENVIHMSQSDIPSDLVQWAKSKIKNVRGWRVTQTGKINVSGAWHEHTVNNYGIFQLSNGRYIKQNEFSVAGWEPTTGSQTINIPSGYLVVVTDSRTATADIYTAPDALKLLQDTSILDELSDEEIMALYESKKLISKARFKFKDEVYNKLIQLKLMNTNRSITIEGKNVVENISRDKIREVVERLNKIYSGPPHYKHFFYDINIPNKHQFFKINLLIKSFIFLGK